MEGSGLTLATRTEAEAMKELVPCWVNIYRSPEGLVSASAHLSEADCLDDISSPAEGWRYVRTIISKGNLSETFNLSDEAADYARRCTREKVEEWRHEIGLMSISGTGRI